MCEVERGVMRVRHNQAHHNRVMGYYNLTINAVIRAVFNKLKLLNKNTLKSVRAVQIAVIMAV